VSDRKPCPSDLSDAAWALIEPVITALKARYPSPTGHSGLVRQIRYPAAGAA
jgi:hypothetical protein